jgi:hypothetical protein
MLAALQNVRPSQLLDQRLWSSLGLRVAPDTEANDESPSGLIPGGRLARGAAPPDDVIDV